MADLAKNRKAFHDYEVLETYEAGISLFGPEVKSCRANGISIADGYASIEGGEVFLYKVHIDPYKNATGDQPEPTRKRRLLLHKAEIRKLAAATQQKGFTLVPLAFYLKQQKIKVKIGVCRGKGHADKRESLKKRDDDKRMRQAVRRTQV